MCSLIIELSHLSNSIDNCRQNHSFPFIYFAVVITVQRALCCSMLCQEPGSLALRKKQHHLTFTTTSFARVHTVWSHVWIMRVSVDYTYVPVHPALGWFHGVRGKRLCCGFFFFSFKQLQQLATSFVSQSVTHCIVRKLISSAKLLSRDLSV